MRTAIFCTRAITRAQRESLYQLFMRDYSSVLLLPDADTMRSRYRAFRRKCFIAFGDCLMVPNWHGMTVGIETDGYTHT